MCPTASNRRHKLESPRDHTCESLEVMTAKQSSRDNISFGATSLLKVCLNREKCRCSKFGITFSIGRSVVFSIPTIALYSNVLPSGPDNPGIVDSCIRLTLEEAGSLGFENAGTMG